MDYKNLIRLSNNELIDLIKLRLNNEKFIATIKDIKIIRRIDKEYLGLRYIIKTKEYADEEQGILLNKFYLDEYKYLLSITSKREGLKKSLSTRQGKVQLFKELRNSIISITDGLMNEDMQEYDINCAFGALAARINKTSEYLQKQATK